MTELEIEKEMNEDKERIKEQFTGDVSRKIKDALDGELDVMINGMLLAMRMALQEKAKDGADSDPEPRLPGLDSHLDKIAKHYEHARAKHPYFADKLFKAEIMADPADEADFDLRGYRSEIVQLDKLGNLPGDFLVKCEIAEAAEAAVRGDKSAAVEECYDAIAVLLRMVDVLEGRQMLGDPAKKEG